MKTMEKMKQSYTKEVQEYVDSVYQSVKKRNPNEEEFLQAVKEVFDSLIPVLAKNPQYIKQAILERIVEAV